MGRYRLDERGMFPDGFSFAEDFSDIEDACFLRLLEAADYSIEHGGRQETDRYRRAGAGEAHHRADQSESPNSVGMFKREQDRSLRSIDIASCSSTNRVETNAPNGVSSNTEPSRVIHRRSSKSDNIRPIVGDEAPVADRSVERSAGPAVSTSSTPLRWSELARNAISSIEGSMRTIGALDYKTFCGVQRRGNTYDGIGNRLIVGAFIRSRDPTKTHDELGR